MYYEHNQNEKPLEKWNALSKSLLLHSNHVMVVREYASSYNIQLFTSIFIYFFSLAIDNFCAWRSKYWWYVCRPKKQDINVMFLVRRKVHNMCIKNVCNNKECAITKDLSTEKKNSFLTSLYCPLLYVLNLCLVYIFFVIGGHLLWPFIAAHFSQWRTKKKG